MALAALILGCVSVILTLGTLFLTLENRLDQNKLQLLTLTIPNVIKSTTDETVQSALKSIDLQMEKQNAAIGVLQQAFTELNAPEQLMQAKLFINLAQLCHAHGSEEQAPTALLKLAKQKLNPTQNSGLIDAIDQDLANLKTLHRTDPENVLSNLQLAKQLVRQLQALTPPLPSLSSAVKTQHIYERWWQNFKSLFVIQRMHNDNPGLLSPQQIELVKASFDLQLDMASWAFMQKNFSLFQSSLHRASELAKESFTGSTALTQVQALLNQLQSTQPEQPTRDLLSYQLISH
jgi:uncharacterized protein HemX